MMCKRNRKNNNGRGPTKLACNLKKKNKQSSCSVWTKLLQSRLHTFLGNPLNLIRIAIKFTRGSFWCENDTMLHFSWEIYRILVVKANFISTVKSQRTLLDIYHLKKEQIYVLVYKKYMWRQLDSRMSSNKSLKH